MESKPVKINPPRIGQIVLYRPKRGYVEYGKTLPALVVEVVDNEEYRVNLRVFAMSGDYYIRDIPILKNPEDEGWLPQVNKKVSQPDSTGSN